MLLLAIAILQKVDTRNVEAAMEKWLLKHPIANHGFRHQLNLQLATFGATIPSDKYGMHWLQRSLGDTRGAIGGCGVVFAAGRTPSSWGSAIFMWPEGRRVRFQFLQDINAASSILNGSAYWNGMDLTMAGSVYYVKGGERAFPCVTTFHLTDGRWQQIQHLEATKEGNSDFVFHGDRIDPNRIEARLVIPPTHLTTFAATKDRYLSGTCEFVRGPSGFSRTAVKIDPSALAELDRLAGLAQEGDRSSFNASVPTSLQTDLWPILQRKQRVKMTGDEQHGPVQLQILAGPKLTFKKLKGKWQLVT